MEKTIRWGIVGAGTIADKFARSVINVPGAELTSVASRTPGKGEDFARLHNIENVFHSYEELAESSAVDAVYIATAHPFHKPCAELFLNAGKHVLCEKPVCVNAGEAESLAECAEKNGVFLMEAMWTRFLPAIKEAERIVKSGAIGKVRGVAADFCYSCTPEEDAKLFENSLAGGALLDVGVYGLNFAAIFLGDNPESITAVSDVSRGVDLQTNILIKFPDGQTASISAAIDTVKPDIGYIFGSDGYISLPRFYAAEEIVINAGGKEKHIPMPPVGDGFEEEIIEACSCIRQGKTASDVMPMSESIRIMKQMDYIRDKIGLVYPMD